jgi:hypothetical protein
MNEMMYYVYAAATLEIVGCPWPVYCKEPFCRTVFI